MTLLLVDAAIGSKELLKPLQQLGLPAELTHLDFGDIAFEGLGEGGTPTPVGIEFKRLSECIQSLRSGRLAGHQLPGLCQTYDHRFLVIEGWWRHDDTGHIVTYQGKKRGWVAQPGKMTAAELEKQLLTLEMLGGLHVRHTNARSDSLRFIAGLYRWFTDRALDRHTSHVAIYHPPPLRPISAFRQAVSSWPGIGIKVSRAVEERFEGSVRRAVGATVAEWAAIETTDERGKRRRFGDAAARRLLAFFK